MFEFTNKSYDLRNAPILKRKRNLTVHFGSESLWSLARENVGTRPRFNQRGKSMQFSKIELKFEQLKIDHVDFAKILQSELDLFKAVPIICIAVISPFLVESIWQGPWPKLWAVVLTFDYKNISNLMTFGAGCSSQMIYILTKIFLGREVYYIITIVPESYTM